MVAGHVSDAQHEGGGPGGGRGGGKGGGGGGVTPSGKPCFRKAYEGSCGEPTCPHLHDKQTMEEFRAKMPMLLTPTMVLQGEVH